MIQLKIAESGVQHHRTNKKTNNHSFLLFIHPFTTVTTSIYLCYNILLLRYSIPLLLLIHHYTTISQPFTILFPSSFCYHYSIPLLLFLRPFTTVYSIPLNVTPYFYYCYCIHLLCYYFHFAIFPPTIYYCYSIPLLLLLHPFTSVSTSLYYRYSIPLLLLLFPFTTVTPSRYYC